MRHSFFTLVAFVVFAFSMTHEASANSRSFHERVEIKPINRGGEVVGVRVSLTLRPLTGHTRVRIGLGPAEGSSAGSFRNQANGEEKYLLHKFAEVTDIKDNTPQEKTFEVLYKDAPELKPGSEIEVVSAWSDASGGYWHVWGMTNANGASTNKYKLPGTPKAPGATAPAAGASSTPRARSQAPRTPRTPRAAGTLPRATAAAATAAASTAPAGNTTAAAATTTARPAVARARATSAAATTPARAAAARATRTTRTPRAR